MKNRVFRARLAALPLALGSALPALILSLPALAAEPEANVRLADIVVTASLSEQVVTDALPFTTVIARDAIERSQAVDLPSLLAREAGFQYTQNGGRGMASTLYLRGSASMQVLVLIDGVPMTKQDTTGAVSLEHIMLDQVERVEIVRGNVSAIYGSGAVGGVIQIFTRQGKGRPSASARLEMGSNGSLRSSAGLGGGYEGTSFNVGLSHFQTRGVSAMNVTQYPDENPDRDGYRNDSYQVSLKHEWSPGQSLGFKADGSSGRFDSDGGGWGTASEIYKGSARRENWSLQTLNQWAQQWRSELSYRSGRELAIYDALLASGYESRDTTQTGTLNWTHFFSADDWLFTGGAETQNQALVSSDNSPSYLKKSRDVIAAFGGVNGNLGQQSFQLNMRHDRADGMDSHSTFYVGYGFQINPALKWVVSASTAFNLPPLGYLYAAWVGNPALRPESARSYETGLQWSQDGTVVRGTAFNTQTRDLLLYDNNSSAFENISRSRNEGLEVIATGPMGGGAWRSSLTLQNPVNESTGQQLVRRAQAMASVGASMPWGGWRWGADLSYTGARPDTTGNPDLPAYALLNLSARREVAPGVDLTTHLDNALDRQYQTAYGYRQLGRAIYVGLNWRQR